MRQAVITYKGSPIDGKTTVADLKDAKLGAQVGTTSYTAVKEQIKPDQTIAVFDTNDLAVQALKNKQIDGIVADLPTAFYMTAAQLDDGVIVGQLPAAGSTPEQFGAVLDKGSPLTACISQAVDALRADGTLDTLRRAVAVDPGRARAEVAAMSGDTSQQTGPAAADEADPWVPSALEQERRAYRSARARRSSLVAAVSTAALLGLRRRARRHLAGLGAGQGDLLQLGQGGRLLPGRARGPLAEHPDHADLRGAHRGSSA